MHVLMFGVDGKPTTFIQRQIDVMREVGFQVSLWQNLTGLPRLAQRLAYRLEQRSSLLPYIGTPRELLHTADVYHFQWPSNLPYFQPIAARLKKPTVLSLRGRLINIVPYMPGYEAYAASLHKYMPHCSAYHCVSQEIMREGQVFGLASERAKVIYTAVDPTFFTPPEVGRPASEPLQIAMVGALIWRKGYEYAVHALKHLLDSGVDARLVIVGEGEERDRIQYTATDLGISQAVHLTGSLPPEKVRQVLRESHIFLHSGLSEGIANVAVEAMACELPLVTTDAGGMGEAVSDGVEGFVVKTRDVKAMAEALIRLSADPELRQTMGKAGRQRALKQFHPERLGREFSELYAFAVEQRISR